MIKSAYIHIPFCNNICFYCAFCKMLKNDAFVDKYLNSLEKEIKKNYKGDILDTLYIGGGTPTSLNEKELTKLFSILKTFKLNEEYEYTFEANILDINEKLLSILKSNRVNRLSIGIESFDENNQKLLNRKASYEEAKSKIDLCKKYFNNINVDLIYAIPNESIKILKSDLDKIISLNVNHVSTYSLMIEPNTVLSINGTLPISDSLDKKMYDVICGALKKEGYIHYEVSNFAKEGFYSKHNSAYWLNDNYYGFGLGASGYIDNLRYTNTKNLSLYLKGNYISQKEILTKDDEITYALILGFRFIKGIDIEKFKKRYNVDLLTNEKVKKLLRNKKLVLNNGSISINKKYIYVENEVLIEFI